jgi:hypothetical protein
MANPTGAAIHDGPELDVAVVEGWAIAMLLLFQVYGLHDVSREEQLNSPIHEHSYFALQPGQLGQIDPTPHQPGEKPRETDRFASDKRYGQLGASGLMTDYAQ